VRTRGGEPLYYIILKEPKDLDDFWRRIEHPDLVVRRANGAEVERPLDAAVPAVKPWVINSVSVHGRVGAEFADLEVDIRLSVLATSESPVWVPIRLDRQKLSSVEENGKDVTVQIKNQQCEVALVGPRDFNLRARMRSPINTTPARKSLTLAIPECVTTALKLEFAQRESDIVVDGDENAGRAEPVEGKGSIVTALLPPRSSIDVSWSNDTDAGRGNSPLLTARGEIEIDIDSEQLRTQSSWDIGCVRGSTRDLMIQIDKDDEVTDIQLDDQQPVTGIDVAQGQYRLKVRLGDALRPGFVRHLVMKTRRPLPREPNRRIAFAGFPIADARQQSGFIGVTESANLWVSAMISPGLRRIYPSLLPLALRERPSTSLAFEFVDQPFALNLDVSPSPPLVKARSRTVFDVSTDLARSETTIELEWVRGRLFEVLVDVGPGLEVSSIGPADAVESHLTTAASSSDSPGGELGPRRLQIRLKSLARDQKTTTLRLTGKQRIPDRDRVKLGLFRPVASASLRASYDLRAERGISIELDTGAGNSLKTGAPELSVEDPFSNAIDAGAAGPGSALKLIAAESPDSELPIHITRHPRSITHDTAITAQVGRGAIEIIQKTTLLVRHGDLTSIDIRVPESLADHWELRDRDLASREEIGRDPDGSRNYRLFFKQRPVTDNVVLTFRSRLPVAPALDSSKAREIAIPRITCSPGTASRARLELRLAPGLLFESSGPGWTRSLENLAAPETSPGPALAFVEVEARNNSPAFGFSVRALDPISVPPVVVPRMLMESVVGPDSVVRCRASYWLESHDTSLEFRLQQNARWVTGRIDGRIAEQVDRDPAHSSLRLWFPPESQSKPVLLELEYLLDAPGADSSWQPPALSAGAVVLQSLWELRLPWESTLLGRPANWSDENQWYWDGYIWKQRSRISTPLLRDWIRGEAATTAVAEDTADVDAEGNYRVLFSRVGPPSPLDARIIAKVWIIASCAAVTLVLGLLVLAARIRFRSAWLLLGGLALLGSIVLQPSALVLAIQSSFAGLFLTLAGFLIQRSVERSRTSTSRPVEPAPVLPVVVADPSSVRGATVGSDESTAIRVRVPASTMEYIATAPPVLPRNDEERSSFLEPA
jgi:hypothetical protein